jgi:hypothetical protein
MPIQAENNSQISNQKTVSNLKIVVNVVISDDNGSINVPIAFPEMNEPTIVKNSLAVVENIFSLLHATQNPAPPPSFDGSTDANQVAGFKTA